MRRSLAEPKNLRASAPIMRFVLSGAPLASIDRVRSGADAAGSHRTRSLGADQVAARRARVHCIAAAGRESGISRASFMQAESSGRFVKPIIAEDTCKRRSAAGRAALIET